MIHWDVHVGYSGSRCCAHNFGTAGCRNNGPSEHCHETDLSLVTLCFHLGVNRPALIGNEWRRYPVCWATKRLRRPFKVDDSLTSCKCGPRGNQSVRCVWELEADVVQKGGSNQKNQSKMAESRESVTGTYFMWIKVNTGVYTTFICLHRLGLLFIYYTNTVRANRILWVLTKALEHYC